MGAETEEGLSVELRDPGDSDTRFAICGFWRWIDPKDFRAYSPKAMLSIAFLFIYGLWL